MIGLARNTDPITSHIAAENAHGSGLILSHRRLITEAMGRLGVPASSPQIADEAGLTQFQVSRRLKEMDNVLRCEKITSAFGSWFYLWSLTPEIISDEKA